MPLVSVIMPTYNQVEYIAASVDSVLAQSVDDLELVIVNDGSTDATPAYLDGLADPRVRVLHQKNQGASAAMTAGFAVAEGRFLTWLASDNLFRPEFLARCLKALENRPDAGLAYTDFANLDAAGNLLDVVRLEPYYPGLLLVNPGAVGVGFLYRREVYERLGAYRDLVCNDLDYWLRAAREWDFTHVPEVLAENRKHGAMQTVLRREELAEQVRERLAGEMAAAPRADPCLMDRLTALRRAAEQLGRAAALRLPPGTEAVAVKKDSPHAGVAAEALRMAGYRVRLVEDEAAPENGEIILALDFETWARLRERGLPVARLDCDHAPLTGADF
ncbi:glycosyltransferase family 2 protein [Desulfohalovibrio reitneri]|uniref:glycosyltransferase family 2 protein n=1 Tax=Desulfohalovibrio reitneri TaxID=1307759 RepID=UPI00068E5DA6|nr:glycosyltransferase [Desulfohalovibrio reitneri]